MAASMLEQPKGRVLVVDDEPEVLRAHERCLQRAGYAVETARSGAEAIPRIGAGGIDVVVMDLAMPKMHGILLLQKLREQDLDLPVIIVTGQPAVETAAEAMQYGAQRYLIKPVSPDVLAREVQRAVSLYGWAKMRRATQLHGEEKFQAGDRAGLTASFNRALTGLWMAYQPIVSWSKRTVYGYEALMRSTEPSLPSPPTVLAASERLDRQEDLGRTVRRLVAGDIAASPITIFVNLHVRDLLDEELYDRTAPLAQYASRIVLEITERAALDEVGDVGERVLRLREQGFRIAIDDLGAGYSSLTSLAQLQPEIVKLDMSLVRGVHKDPLKEKLVRSFVGIGRDMGISIVAEGVETSDERNALIASGCELLQGYLFAKPAKPFPLVSLDAG